MNNDHVNGIGLVEFTPSVASEYLANYSYEHQRKINLRHVSTLAEAMSSGEFDTNTIKIAEVDGKKYLINGQHTLKAIVQSGVTLRLPVITQHVSDMDAVAKDYYHTDIGRKRTVFEAYSVMRLSEKLGMNPTELGQFGAAACLAMSGLNANLASAVTFDSRLEYMLDFKDEAKKYFAAVENSAIGHNAMARRDYMGIGLITFRYVPDRAFEFWHGVANNSINGVGLNEGDPRRTFHYFIQSSRIAGGAVRTGIRIEHTLRATSHVWNAFYSGSELKIVRFGSTKTPIKILGTPFDGKK